MESWNETCMLSYDIASQNNHNHHRKVDTLWKQTYKQL